jgi:hypothetical protein
MPNPDSIQVQAFTTAMWLRATVFTGISVMMRRIRPPGFREVPKHTLHVRHFRMDFAFGPWGQRD